MIVNYQKAIKFFNDCECLVDLEELEKAILWYSEKPVAKTRKIYMHGRYPAVSIYNEKIHVHRLLMMYWENRKLQRQEHVHHKDENKLNSLKENLEIVSDSIHLSGHNIGKKLSDAHKSKIALANKKRKGVKHKKTVNIPFNELEILLNKGFSINSIASLYKCDWSTVKSRIYENPELLGDSQ